MAVDLERIKTILQLTNDGLSEKKFTLAFKSLVDFVKRVKDGLDTKFTSLEASINAKVSKLKDGANGKDGKNGATGVKGEKGKQGEKGESIQGVNGADGSPDTPKMILKKIH